MPQEAPEIRIDRLITNPGVPPAYSNAVFSSRVGRDLVLDFAYFEPSEFHQATQEGGSTTIPAWVTHRVLLSTLTVRRLRKMLSEFEEQVQVEREEEAGS